MKTMRFCLFLVVCLLWTVCARGDIGDPVLDGKLAESILATEVTIISVSDTVQPILELFRATAGPGLTDVDETIGEITFFGYDGDEYLAAAAISGLIGEDAGDGDMPGAIEIKVTLDGEDTPTTSIAIYEDVVYVVGEMSAETVTDRASSYAGPNPLAKLASIMHDPNTVKPDGFAQTDYNTLPVGVRVDHQRPRLQRKSDQEVFKVNAVRKDIASKLAKTGPHLFLFSDDGLVYEGKTKSNAIRKVVRMYYDRIKVEESATDIGHLLAMAVRGIQRLNEIRKTQANRITDLISRIEALENP